MCIYIYIHIVSTLAGLARRSDEEDGDLQKHVVVMNNNNNNNINNIDNIKNIKKY